MKGVMLLMLRVRSCPVRCDHPCTGTELVRPHEPDCLFLSSVGAWVNGRKNLRLMTDEAQLVVSLAVHMPKGPSATQGSSSSPVDQLWWSEAQAPAIELISRSSSSVISSMQPPILRARISKQMHMHY